MDVILILELTGLCFTNYRQKIHNSNHYGRKFTVCQVLAYIRIVFLFATAIAFASRSLYRIYSVHGSFNLQDIGYVVWFGIQCQAIVSMIFVIRWQQNGSMQRIISHIFSPSNEYMRKEMQRTTTAWLILTALITLMVTISTISEIFARMSRNGTSIFEPTMGLHSFDFMYRFIGVYDMTVHNIGLCFFVVIVRTRTAELEQFNKYLKQTICFRSPNASISDKSSDIEMLSNKLLNAFVEHKNFGKKIRELDEVFQVYTLIMVASGTPITIFTLVSLIRIVNTWTLLYLCCCVVHLVGLTLIPAQLYAEYNSFHTYIVCSTSLLAKDSNQRLCSIALLFTEDSSQMKVGISLGGIIIVTKPFIFQCVSILVPYLILCFQYNLGKE